MTAFREWYRGRMLEFDHGFVPPTPRPAYWDDNWMQWTSERLPSAWRFRHRTRSGVVDVSHPEFADNVFAEIEEQLPAGSAFCQVGKSRGGIAMRLDPIVDFADFAAANPIVQCALSTADAWQRTISESVKFRSR